MPGSMQLYGQRRRGLCLSIRPSALHLVYGSYLCCLFSVNTWQSVSSCLFFIALLRVAQANTLVKVSYTGGVYPELVDKTVRKVDLFIYVRRSSGGILNEVVLCQSPTNNAVFILRFFSVIFVILNIFRNAQLKFAKNRREKRSVQVLLF